MSNDISNSNESSNNHLVEKIKLLTGDEDTDFTIRCQGHEFKVRKRVLKGRSKFLDMVMCGPFKESEQGYVDLVEENPVLIAIAIWFFYTFQDPQSLHHREWGKNCESSLLASSPFTDLIKSKPFSRWVALAMLGDRLLSTALIEAASGSLVFGIGSIPLTRDLMGHSDFIQAMMMIFQADAIVPRLRDAIAWKLASTSWILRDPCPSFLSLESRIPELSSPVRDERGENDYFRIARQSCYHCDDILSALRPQTVFVLEPDGDGNDGAEKISCIECTCYCRGFCSTSCRIDNLIVSPDRPFSFCPQCISRPKKIEFAATMRYCPSDGWQRLDRTIRCKISKPATFDCPPAIVCIDRLGETLQEKMPEVFRCR